MADRLLATYIKREESQVFGRTFVRHTFRHGDWELIRIQEEPGANVFVPERDYALPISNIGLLLPNDGYGAEEPPF